MISLVLLSHLAATPQSDTVRLTPGMTITRSVRIAPDTYRLPSSDEDGRRGAITIRGDGITVDFGGATLEGTPPETWPNERKGTAIYVEGRNITIRNVNVRGYKLGLVARNSPGIRIFNSDFSYNWKQRLQSTIEREDVADWMSFHRNENDQWLRYGAAIYLRNSDRFEVKGVKVHGSQCGLMLMESNKGLVWNSDFSFNSAVGLGMYKSSDNLIMHNKIDWNLRGYSHGRWNRGQDSTGILIYEQSNKNTFAYNSVTHSGDGFFLWAGQTTMDTGKGGCNDNLLYGNDFSHAPTNGIEATFSRNRFINNLIMECWHGVWGGYSYETHIVGNIFAYNAEGIAIEHGQENIIRDNIFYRDDTALVLWQNPTQDPNWGYPKNRDTRSRDYVIANNLFSNIGQRVGDLRETLNIRFTANRVIDTARLFRLRGNLTGFQANPRNDIAGLALENRVQGITWNAVGDVNIDTTTTSPLPRVMHPSGNVILPYPDRNYLDRFQHNWNPLKPQANVNISIGTDPQGRNLGRIPQRALQHAPRPLRGGMDPFLKPGALRGRRYMIVDEWGPYDFKRPIVWPRGEAANGVQEFEVLGPKGEVTVDEGAEQIIEVIGGGAQRDRTKPTRFTVPATLRVRMNPTSRQEFRLRFTYVGEETTDVRGIVTPAGQPVKFGFSQFFLPIEWNVRWFAWDDATDPRTQAEAFKRLIAGTPVKTQTTQRLDFMGNVPGVPADRFATTADGRFRIADGEYVIEVTTDDGVRVWLDDRMIIESWQYQGPTLYTAKVRLNGEHRLRVEHFEIDGYSALKVNIRPAGQ